MTERENLFHVLNRTGKAEWTPLAEDCYFSVCPSVTMDRPSYENPKSGCDWFGVHWTYDEAANAYTPSPGYPYVISDITKWEEQLVLPNLDALDWETAAEKDLKNLDRAEKALRIKTESGPFERLWQLYGIENTYTAMYDEPEAFKALIHVLADFRIRVAEKTAKYYKPDIYMTMDDIGGAFGPLISPRMYRELIKPADRKIVGAIGDLGMMPLYHSCGCIQAFMEDLVEMGAKIINPLQGGINDQIAIEAMYGDAVVFENCMDNNLICFETTKEEDIRAEVRRVIDIFWPKQNIIVLTPYILPPKNFEIIIEEAGVYGGGPRAKSKV
jgi:uroporphyrinogen-III decarboxylase